MFAQRSWQTRQAERSLFTLTKGKIIRMARALLANDRV
jgi:hypothetical protein